jgi:hypothetical protein
MGLLSSTTPVNVSNSTGTRSQATVSEAGINRTIIAVIVTSGDSGGNEGNPANYTATLQGVPMFKRTFLTTGDVGTDNAGHAVFALPIDDAVVDTLTCVVSIAAGGATGTVRSSMQLLQFDDVNPSDANMLLDYNAGELLVGSPDDTLFLNTSAQTATGDLVFTHVGTIQGAGDTFSPVGYSLIPTPAAPTQLSITPSGGYNPQARSAYSVGVSGAQDLQWSRANPGDGAISAIAFRMRSASNVPPSDTAVDCDCTSVSTYRTLSQLRVSMARRLGYSAQSGNLPPGMADLLNEFLQDAQQQLYLNPSNLALRTERFYYWDMVPGQRFYGIADSDPTCPKILNQYRISWVGFEDLNKRWTTLVEGIEPEMYTSLSLTPGYPTHYEVRECIEVFPAPQAEYRLYVKGHFGLEPFAADGDRTTIDDQAVFLLALANAKRHYLKPDADVVYSQASNYLRSLIAGTHATARYIPGSKQAPNRTPPTMTEFL